VCRFDLHFACSLTILPGGTHTVIDVASARSARISSLFSCFVALVFAPPCSRPSVPQKVCPIAVPCTIIQTLKRGELASFGVAAKVVFVWGCRGWARVRWRRSTAQTGRRRCWRERS
jgi:hypothetical protein